MFLCTSKSKYGIKYDDAGSIVEEKLHDSERKKEKKLLIENSIRNYIGLDRLLLSATV